MFDSIHPYCCGCVEPDRENLAQYGLEVIQPNEEMLAFYPVLAWVV
jgi:hypothetical protein